MEGFPKPRKEESAEPVHAEEIEKILEGLKGKLDESQPNLTDEYELPSDQAAELNDVLKDIQKG